MQLYPKLYCEKITDITIDYLKKNNIYQKFLLKIIKK